MDGQSASGDGAEERFGDQARLDAVLAALANPARRYLLELLHHDGATATDLASSAAETFGISRARASQHLQVLARAGLVEVQADATWRHYRFREGSEAVVVTWLHGLGSP